MPPAGRPKSGQLSAADQRQKYRDEDPPGAESLSYFRKRLRALCPAIKRLSRPLSPNYRGAIIFAHSTGKSGTIAGHLNFREVPSRIAANFETALAGVYCGA